MAEALFDSGNHLWVTDGTAAGTYELGKRIAAYTAAVLNGEVLYGTTDLTGGLWVSDGTAAGTRELFGAPLSGLRDMFTFNGEVYFDGGNEEGRYTLWKSDGTAAGTQPVSSNGLSGSDFTIFNGELIFNGNYGGFTHSHLVVTDGTTEQNITGIEGASHDGLGPQDMTRYKHELLFSGHDSQDQRGLWVTDGTASGTHELTGIVGASDAQEGLGLAPGNLTVLDGKVLFNGASTDDQGLWVTHGTAASTHELMGIAGANTEKGLDPLDLLTFHGEVLFSGLDSSGDRGLWVTNGTVRGTHEITRIAGANVSGLHPTELTVFDGAMFFDGVDSSGQHGLWETNGTAAGTHEVAVTGHPVGPLLRFA
jgi:ELWxxDGT repeat protein